MKVHYLPKYSPDTNPIERVWWRLHEAVTRNHRCQTMQELLDLTFERCRC
jgi:putative transposase